MTIKEIAQLCGVSRGTVDRVLNHRGKVKPDTEALILRTIHRMGYTKNIAGKALTVKKNAPVFGALVSSEGNPFFDDVIAGFRKAEEDLNDYGVTVMLKTMRGYDVARQLSLIDELTDAGMTVLVIQPINDERIESRFRQLAEKGVATITLNTDIENSCRLCYVGITRAEALCTISFAGNRRVYGQWQSQLPSRFIDELPPRHVQVETPPGLHGGGFGAAAHSGFSGGGFEAGLEARVARADVYNSPGWKRMESRPAHPVPARARTVTTVDSLAFGAGDRVFHLKFGYGAVIDLEGDTALVAFDKAGDKHVKAGYLKPAGAADEVPF